ncbi:MAG: T9SS type A sorting domain-containing protein [Candidatus Zixiibacteriota bacterium]
MRKALAVFATSFILASSLLLVGSALAADPSIFITPDTSVVLSGSDSVRIWISASDPDPLDTITVEKAYGTGTYIPKTDLAPISDEFYFHPDTIGLYTFIFPVTDEGGATSADTTDILVGPLVVDFRQSANDDSPYPPGDVHWIGSILQANNSNYYEGMSSLQRIVFINIPKTAGHVHTLNFSHQANKATAHAYDFVTSWPQGVQAGSEIGGSTMFVNVNECGPDIGPPANLGAICAALHTSGFTATPDAPDPMGTLLGDDIASKVAAYEAQLGNRTIKIYGNTPISAASVTFNGYTGSTDKYADYTVTWTSSSDSIVIEMAGHLAAGTDPSGQPGVGYGAGIGSASIPGGPFHFKLYTLDGTSLGSQDNQIKDIGIMVPGPECNVTPTSQAVCVGSDATFTDNTTGGTPEYTWAWTGPNGFTATTQSITINNAQLVNAGTYQVIVTDANDLKDTCYAVLVVHPDPTCTVDPPSAAICEGESQPFCAVPSGGTPPYTYLWSPGGETTQCITASAAGTYSVTVTDANYCTTNCQATLTVNPPPSCSVDPPSAAICEGESQQFCVVPSGGTPPYTYLWSPGGETTQCITASAAGTYSVTVTDANYCTTNCQATLTVNPNPSCTVDPPSAAICEGESQQFCGVPSGGIPPYTYLWDNGATTQCITVSPPPGTHTYCFAVTDANGCTTSCCATLTVHENPTCGIDPPSAQICEGGCQDFCVQPTGGTPPYSYLWNTGETTQCITKCPPIGSYTYWVKVTDVNDCTTSCEATLEVVENPECTIDPPTAQICEGDCQEFCAVPSGTPPFTYLWNTGEVTQCITKCPPVGSYTYWVRVTDAQDCTSSCEASLTVDENPECTIDPPSAQICEGESQQFCVQPTGGTPPYSYLWSPGGEVTDCITVSPPVGSYTYWVKVTDANDCTTSCGTSLEVVENPTCTLDPPTDIICEGDQATFCVVPTGGTPPYSYLCSPGGEVTDCITVSPPVGSYTYWVKVTDANNCTTSCAATLEAVENPGCTIDPPSAQICEEGSQEFCVQPTGGTPPYTYLWNPGGEATQCITVSPPAGSYTYWVKVTDAQDCTSSCEATLTVVENPTCTVDPPSAQIPEGESQEFCVQPTGGTPPYSYLWNTGETTQCITKSPPPGTYTYRVKVTDASDCTTSCAATLAVECCPSVWIDTVDCVSPGEYVCVPIYVECTPALGGFDLHIDFDYTSMTFVGAERGELIPEPTLQTPGFEKFTYRLLPCPACGCCKYKILLFGMYDMPDGVVGAPIEGDGILVWLCFVINNDENLRGLTIPICWQWQPCVEGPNGPFDPDCAENTFSDVSGNMLYTSRLLCQFDPLCCDDPLNEINDILKFQPYGEGAVVDCEHICGGIPICPPGGEFCKRGDVNYNGVAYEVADAVLFASYFVTGLSVFGEEAYQVCATDVNADGRPLTLGDLVYLIRVILHDAVEIPKLTPSSEVANVIVSNGIISTECAAPIGAILFEFDGAVDPTLLADMQMVHNGNKVLVWSSTGKSFSTAEVLSVDAELVSVSAVDRDSRELTTTITAKVAPTAFALHTAYPNPFNPFTNLSFNLPEAMNYSLKIYNVAGQLVRSYSGVGSQNLNVVTWDGKDNAGSEVSSGIYFYKLTAGSFSATQKMVMMK